MALGIFEQLAWLTTRVKRLCCAVEKIQQSGSGSYKVFTALLTQSGGDNSQTIFAGPLTIGVSYLLVGTYAGDDFSNVGGPKITTDYEYDGTYFVAIGTTPNSWTQGTEIQYNTGAPVATVLENTIGNIWFTYNNNGYYSIRSNESEPLFTYNKTTLFNQTKPSDDFTVSMLMFYVEEFQININTYSDNMLSDGLLYIPTTIEIRVYN